MKNRRFCGPHLVLVIVLGAALWIALTTKQAAAEAGVGLNAPPADQLTWTLLWSDEFIGTGGVDLAGWLYDTGTSYPGGPPNWGTNEIEEMSSSLDNVFQSDGALHLRAIHTGTNPTAGWTSGRIETQRTDFQPPAGGILAVEAAIRLPDVSDAAAQGYWPAFWMLGAPYRGNYWNWPSVGEMTIVESVNGLNWWWGTFHCGTNPAGPCNEPNGLSTGATGFSPTLQSAFHTYRMELDTSVSPQQIRWYVDGLQRFAVDANQVDSVTWANATDHGFFLILDVAIGGNWAGNPTAATASGGEMLVDYVRVFTRMVHKFYLPAVGTN
jgi:beta-glucanase (GH16 family)